MTPSKLPTCTGVLLSVVVPSPSWPARLKPQAHTVPSSFSARLCLLPPAAFLTPTRSLTCTSVLLSVVVPLPSSPKWLPPQALSVINVSGSGVAVVASLLDVSSGIVVSSYAWLTMLCCRPFSLAIKTYTEYVPPRGKDSPTTTMTASKRRVKSMPEAVD